MAWALLPAALVAGLALLHGVRKLRPALPAAGLPEVLAYHKVTRRPELGGTWTWPGRLATHLDRLASAGFTFIDEAAFLEALAGARPLPACSLLLTFDDGYANFREHAWPVLRARGIPALVFLPTDFVGGENTWDRPGSGSFKHLTWNECGELAAGGVSFGSHGASHRLLTRLSDSDLEEELTRSRSAIARALGEPPRSLSYPYGRSDERVRAAARRAGYRAGFTLRPAGRGACTDPYALPRAGVYVIDGANAVVRKITPNRLRWFEELKGRCINGLAGLSPLLGPRNPGRRS